MKSILFALFAATLLFTSYNCKSKQYTANALPENQVRWGSGGAFMGQETSFLLLKNGQFFKTVGVSPNMGVLESIQKVQAKALYKAVKNADLKAMDMKKTGAPYKFIEIRDGDGIRTLVWNDNDTSVDPKIVELYNKLSTIIPVK